MLALAKTRKKTSKTRANDRSSRSHTVMQFSIISCPKELEPEEDPKYYLRSSKINFIDLSGAERGVTQEIHHKTVEEGTQINKSLFALSKCINALARQVKGAYIPYRESKLTRILKDSLGGMTKTTMICHISPCFSKFKESAGTLKYAELARLIPVANQENLKQYRALHGDLKIRIAEDMKKEIARWKAKTEQRPAQAVRESQGEPRPQKAEQLVARLRVICEDQLDIRKNLCDVEAQNKLNEVLASKERTLMDSGRDTAGLEEMFEELKQSSSQNEYIRNHLMKQLEESNQEVESLMRQIYDEIGPKAGRQVYDELIMQKEEQVKRLEMEINLKLYEELNSILLDKVVGMNSKINTMTRQQTRNMNDTARSDTSKPEFRLKSESQIRSESHGSRGKPLDIDRDSQAIYLTQGTEYSKQDRTIVEENDEGSENLSRSQAKNTSSYLANHTFSPGLKSGKAADQDFNDRENYATNMNEKSKRHEEFEFDNFKHQLKTLESESENVFKTTSRSVEPGPAFRTEDSRPDNVVEINETAIKLDKNDKKMAGRPLIDSSVSMDVSPNMDSTAKKFHDVMRTPVNPVNSKSKLKPIEEMEDSIGRSENKSKHVSSDNRKSSSQKMRLENTGYSSLDAEMGNTVFKTSSPSERNKTNFVPMYQTEDSMEVSVGDRQGSVRMPATAYQTGNSFADSRQISPVDLPALMAEIRHDAGSLLLADNMQDDYLDRLPVDVLANPDRMTAIKFGMEGEQTVRWNLNVGWGEEYKAYEGPQSESYPETGCTMEGELMIGERDFMALLDAEESRIFEDLSNKSTKNVRNPLKRNTKTKQHQGLPDIGRSRSTSRDRYEDGKVVSKDKATSQLPAVSNKQGVLNLKESDIKMSSDSKATITANRLPTIPGGSKGTLPDSSVDKYADSSARAQFSRSGDAARKDQINLQATN